MTNEIQIAGPVMSPAVEAVTVKMPAPTTTATPNTVRSHQVRSLCSRVSGSSVSSMDCSTDLVRHRLAICCPLVNRSESHWTAQYWVLPPDAGLRRHPRPCRGDRRQHCGFVCRAGALGLVFPGQRL